MTDTELLDGLQRLFDGNTVVLRTCRSGVKLELALGGFRYADEPPNPEVIRNFREYFGTEGGGEELGPNIRGAIERAIRAEALRNDR